MSKMSEQIELIQAPVSIYQFSEWNEFEDKLIEWNSQDQLIEQSRLRLEQRMIDHAEAEKAHVIVDRILVVFLVIVISFLVYLSSSKPEWL